MKKKRILTREEVDQILDDAWLGILVDENKLFNPLENIPEQLIDEPQIYITWLMSRPEYFHLFCSEILNVKLLPIQLAMVQEIWQRKFPMLIASRGFGKSFTMALYAIMRLALMPGRKLVICGAAFRQSKVIFEYMSTIWKQAPLLRDLVGTGASQGPKKDIDMCRFHVGDGVAIALPIGDGSRIRGQRANDILMDEFASVPLEVFENVIAGFAAVKSSPAESVRETAKEAMAKRFGLWSPLNEEESGRPKDNQIVISGTAYYDFNHFADYWKRWRNIIHTKGDPDKLKTIFGEDEEIPSDFDHRHYSIIRIPYQLIPRGFMDDSMIARSKATIHSGIFEMEFGAVFSNDSNGFFKRSLIESCVTGPNNVISFPSGDVHFQAALHGNPNATYIYGIDPASENDNFSIVIMECHADHARVVYGWTTNKAEFRERVKKGLIKTTDYYGYCARKIRELMTTFPCERIMLDSQGGGIAISESLHDLDKIDAEAGEVPIWPIIDPEKPKDTDGEGGKHLIEMVNFASADWTGEANHGLRKDFEDKACLFPEYNAAVLGLAHVQDQYGERLYDTLEDCIMELEELKNELCTIIITQTNSGRDRWDTPEVKLPGNKKGHLRKDRYSALIMANMGARELRRNPERALNFAAGGFALGGKKKDGQGPLFTGPAWFTNKMHDIY